MLQTKPQGHWPFGSGEEDFKGFLPHVGMSAILVMWPRCGEYTSVPPIHWGSIWNLAPIGTVVSEEITFEELSLYEYVKQVTLRVGHFWPMAEIWTILVEVHNITLHTKYQRPRPSSYSQEEF